MDKQKIKLLIRDLELTIESLKNEIYSKEESVHNLTKPDFSRIIYDYDEIFEEDDNDY